MLPLIEHIESLLKMAQPSPKRLYIGYSGGLDSHVLLHVCASQSQFRSRITAVYIHHGLQEAADAWEIHCAETAKLLEVSYQSIYVDGRANTGESPEEAARNARYAAFAELLDSDDLLLLAQHQDDQLETTLLQLFRGAGLQGLAGMPESAILGRGKLLRPFLHVTRQELETYALSHGLKWVEDPTNQSLCFDRNYLRQAVIPLLKQRWPKLAQTVSRSAKHCGSAHEALSVQTEQVFATLFDARVGTLDLSLLISHSDYQQRLLIRRWFHAHNLRMPSTSVLETLFTQLIIVDAANNPELQYQHIRIRKFRGQLYCLKSTQQTPVNDQWLEWPASSTGLALSVNETLTIEFADCGIDYRRWNNARVTVGFRQGGERIRLPKRSGHHSLKKLFQEAAIPVWERNRIPLVYLDGTLAAVADLWTSADVWTEKKGEGIRLRWQRPIKPE